MPNRSPRAAGLLLRATAAAVAYASAAHAQPTPPAGGGTVVGARPPGRASSARDELFTGAELESYLRTLQAAGLAGAYPWSLRGFSPAEVDRLLPTSPEHPWAGRYDLTRVDSATERRARDGVRLVRPTIAARYNSAFPFGSNDGAVWAGRGLTSSVQAGVAARWGPLSLTLVPIAFRAENAAFDLADNGRDGALRFAHAQYATSVDVPQRFGDAAYQRVDPGQSTLRLDLAGVAAGISTANAWWGPASQFPFLLGNNAAGFPHVFVGTARPAYVWIGHVHTRLLWGRLDQSEYFDPAEDALGVARPRRFAAGLIGVFQPRGVPGLEVGAARFFHAPWPESGLPGRYVARPFEGILKKSLDEPPNPIPTDPQSQDGENQLASFFGRWVLPRSGFEAYFEFGRDDHNWDGRDLWQQPDHQASMLWGVRKSWRRGAHGLVAARLESLNYESHPIGVFRNAAIMYAHSSGSNQGHTQRGQLLGADAGVGSGAGAVAAVDWYRPDGRWSASWTRVLRGRQDRPAEDGAPNDVAMDVVHSLGVERLLFAGAWDLTAGLTGSYEFNRDFRDDRRNLSVRLAVTGLPW